MTPHDQAALEHMMFAVEDLLHEAVNVERDFEAAITHAATLVPARREELAHHLRILLRPLADLELKRRAGKSLVEDDFWLD